MNNKQDFTTSILVDKTPHEVFRTINDVREWWQGEFTGHAEKLNEDFVYQMGDVHLSRQKVVELIPDKKVVWLVTDSKLSFVDKKDEWTDTTLIFDIVTEGNKTKVTFTHHGLVPEIECYGGCSTAWKALIEKSLYSFITTGKGVDVF